MHNCNALNTLKREYFQSIRKCTRFHVCAKYAWWMSQKYERHKIREELVLSSVTHSTPPLPPCYFQQKKNRKMASPLSPPSPWLLSFVQHIWATARKCQPKSIKSILKKYYVHVFKELKYLSKLTFVQETIFRPTNIYLTLFICPCLFPRVMLLSLSLLLLLLLPCFLSIRLRERGGEGIEVERWKRGGEKNTDD